MIRSKLVAVFTAAMVAATLACVPGQAQQKGKQKKAKRGQYVHTVVFYVKKDAPEDTVSNAIRDCHRLLRKIPTVRVLRVGRPAAKATPKVAANDYSFALTIFFDDYEGLTTYLEHKLHLQFVDRYQNAFERVVVYDFVNQPK